MSQLLLLVLTVCGLIHIGLQQDEDDELIVLKSPRQNEVYIEEGIWEELHFVIGYPRNSRFEYRISVRYNNGVCISDPAIADPSVLPLLKAQEFDNTACPYPLQGQDLLCDRLIIAVPGNQILNNKTIALCVHRNDITHEDYPEQVFILKFVEYSNGSTPGSDNTTKPSTPTTATISEAIQTMYATISSTLNTIENSTTVTAQQISAISSTENETHKWITTVTSSLNTLLLLVILLVISPVLLHCARSHENTIDEPKDPDVRHKREPKRLVGYK